MGEFPEGGELGAYVQPAESDFCLDDTFSFFNLNIYVWTYFWKGQDLLSSCSISSCYINEKKLEGSP